MAARPIGNDYGPRWSRTISPEAGGALGPRRRTPPASGRLSLARRRGVEAWLAAFVFTQLVEVPIYAVGLRATIPAAFGASALTHPIVWFVLFPLLPLSHGWLTVVAEIFAVAVESAYFAVLFRRRRAWAWALLANAASLGTGLFSRALFGVP